ncbi:MAG: anaerobic sulfatase maturase [Bacteroidaceae bacterium]|nr:anaerobic sulfatase maturase [Bacteroidaceae bacterium]MBR6171449.1 anaerobic sulfatase maturase [Bacteroidaceae bacterium]
MPGIDDFRHYAIEVKPIGAACNLRCEYCYYLGKEKTLSSPSSGGEGPLMSDEVLERYIQQVVAIHGRQAEIEFAWHGGEPTLCGIPFFERAMDLQQKYGANRRILNTLQTNGTLLTDDWCRFFRDHNFRIGLSIDGPEPLHNIYRKDAHGEGTFWKTMHGMELLQKHGVEFNTLTTVNAANVAHAAQVYDFLRQFSNFMQFLPVVESLSENQTGNVGLPPGLYTTERSGQLAPFSVPAEAYGKFLCTILDQWMKKDVGRKFVQVIEAAIGNLTRRPAGLCVHEAVCGHCGVIEKNGDLYRCDRYVFPEYRVGNILDAPLHEMMQTNRRFGEFKLESLPSQCLHCDVADLCFGGCPKDRLLERLTAAVTPSGPVPQVERRNYLCPGYKMFFQYVRHKFPEIVSKIQSK